MVFYTIIVLQGGAAGLVNKTAAFDIIINHSDNPFLNFSFVDKRRRKLMKYIGLLCAMLISTQYSFAQDLKEVIQKLNQSANTDKDVDRYYERNKGDDKPSVSTGSPGNGGIRNAKLLPFSGPNFTYFDTLSYVNGRAFVHNKVLKTVLSTYDLLAEEYPKRKFFIMECSHRQGGKLFPHHTHQNGLSVDFMMPLIKNGKPHIDLDNLGSLHYLMEFDDQGRYIQDKSVIIDFELVAAHILALQSEAKNRGLAIKKVIINTNLKDELLGSKHGKLLKDSDIYLVKSLSPMINSLHDDHFHIDFIPN